MDYPQAVCHPSADFSNIRAADNACRMTPGAKIRALLEAGLTQEAIAERIGVAQSSVNRWARDQADPRGSTRDAIDELYQSTVSDKAEGSTSDAPRASIPGVTHIVGKAGAGPQGEVIFDSPQQFLGMVAAPMNATASTVALEVQGDSMRGIANDGWLVFYDDRREAPSELMYGELCVVGLEDGRTLVKFLAPGRAPGVFDLESMNASTMRDVPVRWAALVTNIVPRHAARRIMRDDPSIGVRTAKAN